MIDREEESRQARVRGDKAQVLVGLAFIIMGVVFSHLFADEGWKIHWLPSILCWFMGSIMAGAHILALFKESAELFEAKKDIERLKKWNKTLQDEKKEKHHALQAETSKHSTLKDAIQAFLVKYLVSPGLFLIDGPNQSDECVVHHEPIQGLRDLDEQLNNGLDAWRTERDRAHRLSIALKLQMSAALRDATRLSNMATRRMIHPREQMTVLRNEMIYQLIELIRPWGNESFEQSDSEMEANQFYLIDLLRQSCRPDVVEDAVRVMMNKGSLPADPDNVEPWEMQLIQYGTHEAVWYRDVQEVFESQIRPEINGIKKRTSGRVEPPVMDAYEWICVILALDKLLLDNMGDVSYVYLRCAGQEIVYRREHFCSDAVSGELIRGGYLRETVHDYAGQIALVLHELLKLHSWFLPNFVVYDTSVDCKEVRLQRRPEEGIPKTEGGLFDMAKIWATELS